LLDGINNNSPVVETHYSPQKTTHTNTKPTPNAQ